MFSPFKFQIGISNFVCFSKCHFKYSDNRGDACQEWRKGGSESLAGMSVEASHIHILPFFPAKNLFKFVYNKLNPDNFANFQGSICDCIYIMNKTPV